MAKVQSLNDQLWANARGVSGMGQTITGQDPGYTADVNSRGELLVTRDSEWLRAVRRGDAYLWQNTSADIDTGDTMILVRNDSNTKLLVINTIAIINGNVAATTYDIHLVTAAFTAAGTAVTPVNMNGDFGTSSASDITAYADETGNTQGTVLAQFITTVASDTSFLTSENCAFLPFCLSQGRALGIDQITESTAGVGGIYAYLVDK